MNRIADGEKILIDGATGTELERLGVPMVENAWNSGGTLSHPDTLRQVHEDYIRAGAELIIANTFGTHGHALRDAGVADQFESINRRAVEIAIEARERTGKPDVLVGGGMSYWSWADKWRAPADLRDDAEKQAAIMAAAGADLLMLEMMSDIDCMLVTLDAALSSGLPVWPGLSCKPDETGVMNLLRGGPLREAVAAIKQRDVPLISIMHTEVDYIAACLDVLDACWDGPVGIYAHSARWVGDVCHFDVTCAPDDYAAHAQTWLDRGVQVIGGCCGMGVAHINCLKHHV